MARYDDVMAGLRAGLKKAIREKNPAGMAAMRSAIAALGNAGAVPVDAPERTVVTSQYIAGASEGLGAAEMQRRDLSDEEVDQIITGEIASRNEEAKTFDAAKRDLEASMARYQASILTRILENPSPV